MVVALLALSLVMILGGVAAVVQGFPYVRLESGLAMVIGGSTAASAGVILLGLSAVVDRLRRVQQAVIRLREEGIPHQGALPAATDTPAWLAAPNESAMMVPSIEPLTAGPGPLAGAAGLAGLGLGTLGAARPGGRGSEPVFEDPEPTSTARQDIARQDSARQRTDRQDIEPLLPDLLPEVSPRGRPDDELFAVEPVATAPTPEPQPALPVAEGLGLRPSIDLPADEAMAPGRQAPDAPSHDAAKAEAPEDHVVVEPEPERHAVGSYASGANTYVMFSDGSIEADTPRGRFTFGSLDELKSFVNAGGEETRGAA